MKIKSNLIVTVRDLENNILEVKRFRNRVTTVGRNMIRDAIHAVADIADCEIKYVELGTSNAPPAATDTTLGATFLAREQVIQTSKPGDRQTWCMAYFAASDAIGAVEEIGWFAGALATGVQDSGIMVSRVLYSLAKTALITVQIERKDEIVEG